MKDASNPATTTLYVVLSLSLLTIGLAPLGAAQSDGPLDVRETAVYPPWECVEQLAGPFSVLCPDTPPKHGASCVSHGIVIVERDFTGAVGSIAVTQSTSRADTGLTQGSPIDLDPFDGEPDSNPDAHADAQQAGFAYNHGFSGLNVDARVVDSRCDVSARLGEISTAAAYGEAGIADLHIDQSGAPILSAGVLRQTIDAVSEDGLAQAGHACETARLQIFGGGPTACPTKNTGVNLGGANLVLNEVWGPLSADGQHLYGGAAAHLTVFGIGQIVDVYIGYTAVSVPGNHADDPHSI